MRLRSFALFPLATAFALSTVPIGALAETFSLYFNTESDGIISYEECLLKKTKPIYYDCGGNLGTKMVIYASPSGACTNTPGSDAVILLAEHQISSASDCKGVLSINSSSVVGDMCGCDETQSLQICAATKAQAYNYETLLLEWVESETISQALTYDAKPPNTPTLESLQPGDGKIHVKFSGASDISQWEFCVEALGSASEDNASTPEKSEDSDITALVDEENSSLKENEGTDGGDILEPISSATCDVGSPPFDDRNCFKQVTLLSSDSRTSGKISGLENGVTYRITLAGRDLAGNYSGTTASLEATPVAVQDFFGAYVGAGGSEEGGYGCSATSSDASPWSALALMSFLAGLLRQKPRCHRRNTRGIEAKDSTRPQEECL